VTLRAVLPMSRMASIPRIIAYAPAIGVASTIGNPMEDMTMASMIAPAPGTPAVPMEANVALRTTMHICPNVRELPVTERTMNIAQTP